MKHEDFQKAWDAAKDAEDRGIQVQVFFNDRKPTDPKAKTNRSSEEGTVVNILSRDRDDTKASDSRIAICIGGKVVDSELNSTNRKVPKHSDMLFVPTKAEKVVAQVYKQTTPPKQKIAAKKSRARGKKLKLNRRKKTKVA